MYEILPQDWTQEHMGHSITEGKMVFHAPGFKGGVSVDFDIRAFRRGINFHGPVDSTKPYTGRGWRQALVTDTVEYLRGVLESEK